jgi:hypothetical protein
VGKHSLHDDRVYWRSLAAWLGKTLGLALLPLIAGVGFWKLARSQQDSPVAGTSATHAASPSASALAKVTPSPSPIAESPSPQASPTSQPGKLQVLNGSGTPGLGLKAKKIFEDAGWTIVATANASRQYSRTTVFFQPGSEAMAKTAAGLVGSSTVQPALSNLDRSIPVTVVVGTDFKG